MSISRYPIFDISGGVQAATSFLMKKANELANIRNGRFGIKLGSIVRRNGYTRAGSTFGAGGQNTPTGGFVAKYSSGNVRFVAVNNSGSTATIIRTQNSGSGAWTTLTGTSIPVNAVVNFFLYLDEVYITGYDPATGDPITPYNVNYTEATSSNTVSSTRNIRNMPKAYFIQEYLGALYACNVKIDSTRYPDRAYKSSGPLGAVTFVQSEQLGALSYLQLDSVRYLKAGMDIDVYTGGTDTKIYDINITSVDKVNNRINFTPNTQSFDPSGVNASTDVITLSSASGFPTGTPIVFSSNSAVPGGLVAGTRYFAINTGATTIKVAATAAQASGGLAINLTSGGATQTFATTAVDIANDIITLANTTSLATAMPIVFTSTTTVPAGLVSGTVYYCIVVSSTTIKVASSVNNANAGTAINITSQGTGTHTITSGTHTISQYYSVSDNDEIWLDGRKNTLNILWNTDYRTPELADWTATRPGVDSSAAITGVAKSSNRLFLFTKNSGQKWDGANTVTYNNAVGCASHRTICNIDDDWMVWLDIKGRVWARNETTGQQEYISRGIYRQLMKYVPLANLLAANATVNENHYYLYLGQFDSGEGNEYIRVVYSFDDNVWAIDRVSHPILYIGNDDYSGELKPYFHSTDGFAYIDNDGNLDHDKTIPLEIELGRDNQGSERLKKYDGMFLYTENANGMNVKVAIDGGQPKTVGTLGDDPVSYIKFPERGEDALPRGTSANILLDNTGGGDPESIDGIVLYYSVEEGVPSDRRPRI